MKKLLLNKRVIAQLNSPDNIYGGAEQSHEPACYPPIGIHKTSDGYIWKLTQGWNCPSNDYSFCEGCDPKPNDSCVCPTL